MLLSTCMIYECPAVSYTGQKEIGSRNLYFLVNSYYFLFQAPDYFDIVKQPMDFSTIRNRINRFEYTNPKDILEDVRLIFKNCNQYNMPTAPEFIAGQKLSRYFEKRVKEQNLTVLAGTVKSPKKGQSSTPSPKRSSRRR